MFPGFFAVLLEKFPQLCYDGRKNAAGREFDCVFPRSINCMVSIRTSW